MTTLLVVVSVVLILILAVVFFLFRGVGCFIYWFVGLIVFAGILLGIGWLASHRDRLPFDPPASVDSFLSFVSDPIFFIVDLVEGFFRIF